MYSITELSRRIQAAIDRDAASRLAYDMGSRKYWYYRSEYYCPVCARTQVYRSRMYQPRPEDWEDRHEFVDSYDYCDAL